MYQTRAQNVTDAVGGSVAQRIIRFLKGKSDEMFCHNALAKAVNAKESTVRATCSRLVTAGRLIKCKKGGLSWYCAPGGTMESYFAWFNLCKDLPYAKVHDVKLYREWPVSHRAILGIAKILDPDSLCFNDQNQHRGSRPWRGRTLSWQLGYNIPRVKGPSITLDLDSSDDPLDFDEWISFLDFIYGLTGFDPKEEPKEWKILQVGLSNDILLGPNVRRIHHPVTIDIATGVLARLYDKPIGGEWYRRDETHYKADAEEAITLFQWAAGVQGGLDRSQLEMTVVNTLNHLKRDAHANRQSQQRMERLFQEAFSVMSGAIKDLAEVVKELQEGFP